MRDETKHKLDRVKELIANGSTVADACKEVGVSGGTYHKYRKVKSAPKKQPAAKPERIVIPDAAPQTMVAFVGSPSDVVKAVKEYNHG